MFRILKTKSRGRNRKTRAGIECVEVAISLPLLMIVMFSTIQICHLIHTKKMLRIACTEAMKAGASKEGSSEEAIRVFKSHAVSLGITDAELKIDTRSFDRAQVGDALYLEASAPFKSNRLPAPITVSISKTISGGVVFYRKEGI